VLHEGIDGLWPGPVSSSFEDCSSITQKWVVDATGAPLNFGMFIVEFIDYELVNLGEPAGLALLGDVKLKGGTTLCAQAPLHDISESYNFQNLFQPTF
jgi:hypothetical protein